MRATKGRITILHKLKQTAKLLKSNLIVLYLSYRDPRVKWYAKLFTLCVVAYAFSPIDLIPDFIPILGYIDDLIIVPLGIVLALKMIPGDVIGENKAKAQEIQGKPKSWVTAALFIIVWILLAIWIATYIYKKFRY
ncbi:YkvA family protein [Paenibacillus sp. JX-17]|uniref:YkvA family protein n=1 Tax=Paenibacillus lacisoli TaxID=3064525 RepID=A0ABT9CE35_9BACL|nr:YkvA family protein [Paenibacillus sp. JX-17]MDO7907521.1 YkvA family protein [Paenibacillus sp. JX-17]